MNKPNYVLKFKDTIAVTDAASSVVGMMSVLASSAFIILLLWDWNVMAGIIGAAVTVLLVKNGFFNAESFKWESTPCELWFYDDYFIQYYERRQYGKNIIKKEYHKMYYRDVKECLFKKRSKKIGMIGLVDVVSYSYDSNGKIIEESKEKKLDGYTFVNFMAEPNINFV